MSWFIWVTPRCTLSRNCRPLLIEPFAVVLQQQPAVAVDAAQRRLEVVGYRVGKGFEFLVRRRQFLGPCQHPRFEVRIERADLLSRRFRSVMSLITATRLACP